MATESEVAQTAETLRATMQGQAAATVDQTNKTKALSDATTQAYNSLRSLAGGLAQGRSEVSQLNQVYELAGQAVGKAARAAGDFAGQIPIIGGLFSAAGRIAEEGAKAAAQGLGFLNQQIDVTVKQFQEFGTIGALSARGMTGLREQMVNSGMTMAGFQRNVMANSQALAAFAGTTSEGAEKFSAIVGAITTDELGNQLRNIGMSADQIGEAAAGFIAREQRLGRAQGMSQDQLTKGAVAYARELDTLARLTGQSADSIRKQQDAAMSESRYRAAIFKLDKNTQERLQAGQSLFANTPQLAKGIRDLVSGVGDTVESQQLLTLTGGQAQDAVNRLKLGLIDEFQFRKELTEKIRENAGAFADIAQFGDGVNAAVGNFAQIADASATNVDGIQSATTTQKKLAQGTDELTQSVVNAAREMEKFSRFMMNLVTTLMPLASRLNERTIGGIVTTITSAAEIAGIPIPPLPSYQSANAPRAAAGGAGVAPPAVAAPTTAARPARSTLSPMVQNAMPGATLRQQAGLAPVATNPAPTTTPPGNPQDLLQFEGTSLQNFQSLDSRMQAAILTAAQDFYRDTGQKLRISSAYRTREQQEALWNNRGNNPYPVAPPGTSRHEHGQAVDILNFQAAERYLRQQGLYRPDPGGDRIHFEYGSGDANGITGPTSGYRPTLNSSASASNTSNNTAPAQNNADNTILAEQLIKLDRIAAATERQAQLAQQMLSYAS